MPENPELIAYTKRLRRLTTHLDPMAGNPHANAIRNAAASIDALPDVSEATMVQWVADNPFGVYTLALAVGLSQEKLKNLLRPEFETAS